MLILGHVAENFDIMVSVTHCTGTVALDNWSRPGWGADSEGIIILFDWKCCHQTKEFPKQSKPSF